MNYLKATITGFIAIFAINYTTVVLAQSTPSYEARPIGKKYKALEKVNEFHGSFQTSISIEAPAYFGVTPSVDLQYDSTTGNGYAGLGWQIGGFSTIDRAGTNKGMPRYDSSDIWLASGYEVMPCSLATDTAVSCSSGGTHFAKMESYNKFVYNEAASEWTVWSGNGVKTIFKPIKTVSYGGANHVAKYGIDKTVDLQNNQALYQWTGTADWPRPWRILYGPYQIFYYWESRSDHVSKANGSGIDTLTQRLKSILVKHASYEVTKFYDLEYSNSGTSNRSKLTQAQVFGHDAVVNGLGEITNAGSASQLPPTVFNYGQGSKSWTLDSFYSNKYQRDSFAAPAEHFIDVNGDGFSDIVRSDSCNMPPSWNWTENKVFIQTSSGFEESSEYVLPIILDQTCGLLPAFVQRFGDFNGDGLVDIATDSAIYVNTGHGWVNDGSVGHGGHAFKQVSDVNGDGLADLVNPAVGTFINRGYKVNGDSFYSDSAWVTPISFIYNDASTGYFDKPLAEFVDINGDALPDIVKITSEEAYLNNGHGWEASSTAYQAGAISPIRAYVDVNGDGRNDQVKVTSFTPVTTSVYENSGQALVAEGSYNLPFELSVNHDVLTQGTFTDVNGDGFPDMVRYSIHSPSNFIEVYTSDIKPEIIESVTNSFGGDQLVEYQPSTTWDNSLPCPSNPAISCSGLSSVYWTVTKVTIDSGVNDTSSTEYAYEGGLFDYQNKRFLGFRYARTTLPKLDSESSAPCRETWYLQDYGSLAKPEVLKTWSASNANACLGSLLSEEIRDYSHNGNLLPYKSLLTDHQTIHYGPTETMRSAVTKIYDDYGNLTQETFWGSCPVSGSCTADGDEKTIQKSYFANATKFITSLPAAVRTFAGVGTGGTLAKESITYYDDQASYDVPPSHGLATRTAKYWYDPSTSQTSYLFVDRVYDSYGNLLSETDPMGVEKSLEYDATYNLLVTKKTLAANKSEAKITTIYNNPVCLKPQIVTDPNSNLTLYSFDHLCRNTRIEKPGGEYTDLEYVNLGSVGLQHIRAIKNPISEGGENGSEPYTLTYFDGFARTYKTVNAVETHGDITNIVEYNQRGKKSRESKSYYSGETPDWTDYDYDALNRLVKTTYPDGTFASVVFDAWTNTATDPDGHQVRVEKDAYNRIIRREEKFAGSWIGANFGYHPVYDHLTQVVGPKGEMTTFTIDTLGRKVSMHEPNNGSWQYGYDALGRTTKEVDATGQMTFVEFDGLGRVLRKVFRGVSEASSTSYRYDEPRSGYHNRGHMTTVLDQNGVSWIDYDEQGREARNIRAVSCATYKRRYITSPSGERLAEKCANGEVVQFHYDLAGRITEIPNYVDDVDYTATGKVTSLERATTAGLVTQRTYNNRDWLQSINVTDGGQTLQDDSSTLR